MVNLGEIGGLYGGCIVFVIMYLFMGVEFLENVTLRGLTVFREFERVGIFLRVKFVCLRLRLAL